METQAISSVASSYPPWVMLKRQATRSSDEDSAADVKTLATGRTTSGHLVGVSLSLAAPPAASRICVQIPDGVEMQSCHILAAHGDSILVEMFCRGLEWGENDWTDYFVYNAGDAAAKPPRPPSLMLLPFCPVQGALYNDTTGLLCRGEDDELVVAELRAVEVGERRSKKKVPKLLMLRSGEWIVVKKPLISHVNGEVSEMLPPKWNSDTVFPVNDRTLCWVDLSQGVIFCDVLHESPGLRYVPLPTDPNFNRRLIFRNVCATAGGTVKFVNIFPRCCCGGAGASYCRHSNNAYTIQSWTLRMDDSMSWVMDGMVDSTELWSLDAYKGLPRIRLAYPVVALDKPHLICFMLCEDFHVNNGDETVWMIMVDMRSKTMPVVRLHPGGRGEMLMENLVPSKVSYYLNSVPNRSNGGASLSRNARVDSVPAVNVVNEVRPYNVLSSAQSPCKTCGEPAVQESAFLTAFQEIATYGLARDDMLKAYSLLSDDNCRRFKSLIGLPMNLRKDWLLMEIKASEA
ncbi:unnamed protein product [Urochloa decumbens]|uniref:DUF1618 domain-containing protein n=1 Tax=Urochloa decumbens TaxID=240449 RepID=A0ABC9B3C9_9POAL